MQKKTIIHDRVNRKFNIKVFCLPCSNFVKERSTKKKNDRNNANIMNDLNHLSSAMQLQKEQENQYLIKTVIELLESLYFIENRKNEEDYKKIIQALSFKKLSPNIVSRNSIREDLEYYIPYLINLIFKNDQIDKDLEIFLINSCSQDYLFSHYCYFYLKSLCKIQTIANIQITQYLQKKFIPKMQEIYQSRILYPCQFQKLSQKKIRIPTIQQKQTAQKYGTPQQDQIILKVVKNIYLQNYHQNTYFSTPIFWEQLIQLGNNLPHYNPKKIGLLSELKTINKKLPALIYVPLLKQSLRKHTVLNIDINNLRVFSTKSRSPYSIYIQIIQIDQLLGHYIQQKKQKAQQKNNPILDYINTKLEKARIMMKNQHKKQEFTNTRKRSNSDSNKNDQDSTKQNIFKKIFNSPKIKPRKSSLHECQKSYINSPKVEQINNQNSIITNSSVYQSNNSQDDEQISDNYNQDKFFGVSYQEVEKVIHSKSIYKNFKSWKLIHLLIKTGDNLRQEQFAMQLINQFDIIFAKSDTGLVLTPYQVISIGPDSGIIQMLNDVVPLSKIYKVMKNQNIKSFSQFFTKYYKKISNQSYKKARSNFCKSLAAYSLVTYFLQIKDRHNDNILLHRDGRLIHIDFGFFLSNAPGRGIEVEKKLPFKLTSAYMDIIGEYNHFQFRVMFQKGFKAVIKHKQDIIPLVKMMYESNRHIMPCFKGGEQGIKQLQMRLNPQTQNLTQHCNNLINESLDNWRARWYDKFQYWLQDIMY